jgi:hypothetical protein
MFVATAAACVTTFGAVFGTWRPVAAAFGALLACGCGASVATARAAFATAVGVGDGGELLGDASPAVRAVCGLETSCFRVATAPGLGVVAAAVEAAVEALPVVLVWLADEFGVATAVAVGDGVVAGIRAAWRAIAVVDGVVGVVGEFAVGEFAVGEFDASRRAVCAGVAVVLVGVAGASTVGVGAAAVLLVAVARCAGAVRGCGVGAAEASGVGCGVSTGAAVAVSTRVVARGR